MQERLGEDSKCVILENKMHNMRERMFVYVIGRVSRVPWERVGLGEVDIGEDKDVVKWVKCHLD